MDLLVVDNPRYHQYLNICFKQMLRGQTAWIRVGENWHKGGYHLKKFLQKPYMKEEADVGRDIWIKVELCQIKRDPRCAQNASWEERLAYLEKVRATCKELVEQGEYSWASDLYARCV